MAVKLLQCSIFTITISFANNLRYLVWRTLRGAFALFSFENQVGTCAPLTEEALHYVPSNDDRQAGN